MKTKIKIDGVAFEPVSSACAWGSDSGRRRAILHYQWSARDRGVVRFSYENRNGWSDAVLEKYTPSDWVRMLDRFDCQENRFVDYCAGPKRLAANADGFETELLGVWAKTIRQTTEF